MSATGETMVSAERTITAPTRTELDVRGMDCQNCVRHVREALASVPGVAHVSVDLPAHRATVRWNAAAQPNIEAALRAVTEAGYEPSAVEDNESAAAVSPSIWSGWAGNLIVGMPALLVLMLGEWAFGWTEERWFQWLSFALASVVQAIGGARFYRGAWRQLKAGNSNMDTLVALGSTTAFVYSVWAIFHHAHAFFMESVAIISLISVGHWIEGRMSEKAAGSMKKLLALAPDQARKKHADGTEELVPAAELERGDIIALRPGERAPIDGVVIEGAATVDESMLTGESMPQEKKEGAQVYGGTVNLDGAVKIRVETTGEGTALAQIIAAVEKAQGSRASIQRLGDRVSSVFVPIVVVIAIVAALWWGLAPDQARATAEALSKYLWPIHVHGGALALAVIHAAAVLIVACPCAMGLATPAAIMAGANAAAERGILIRDGVALEKAGQINTVVFDKTGTLTHGTPSVTGTEILQGEFANDALSIAAALARHSNHPLSRAIAGVSTAPAELEDWQELRGSGVRARWRGQEARLGSLRWLESEGIAIPSHDAREGEVATMVGLAIGSKMAARFSLEDTLKDGAAQIVGELRQAGLEAHLLSGDNVRTARAIARQVGIEEANVTAEVRPEQKAEFIRKLQERGDRVAFVGDGLNDAPALEQADLGVAVGRATDVAKMAADIVLLNSDVHAIPQSLAIARATLRVIKQNLFWAFFYNSAAIPLAALGFISPILCALTMGLSDVVVIGNALRLRLAKR